MREKNSPIYARTLRELRELPDDSLVDLHDELATQNRVVVSIEYYLKELQRREADRRETQMLYLTRVVLALTVVNVLAVAAQIFFA